jgi:hypothetical protein
MTTFWGAVLVGDGMEMQILEIPYYIPIYIKYGQVG